MCQEDTQYPGGVMRNQVRKCLHQCPKNRPATNPCSKVRPAVVWWKVWPHPARVAKTSLQRPHCWGCSSSPQISSSTLLCLKLSLSPCHQWDSCCFNLEMLVFIVSYRFQYRFFLSQIPTQYARQHLLLESYSVVVLTYLSNWNMVQTCWNKII